MSGKNTVQEVITGKEHPQLEGWETVESALAAFGTHQKRALAIVDEGVFLGIFTYQDLMGRVLGKGLNPQQIRVADVMTSVTRSVTPDCNIHDAFNTLITHKVSHLPVVGKNGFVGILSEEDLRPEIAHDLQELANERKQLISYINGGEYGYAGVAFG